MMTIVQKMLIFRAKCRLYFACGGGIMSVLFGETGENPVRVRRREVHVLALLLLHSRNMGDRSLEVSEKAEHCCTAVEISGQ